MGTMVVTFASQIGEANPEFLMPMARLFATGKVWNGAAHLPEVEIHHGDPVHIRLAWLIVGNLIGVIVLCLLHDIYAPTIGKKIRTWIQKARLPWKTPSTIWPAFGWWVDPEHGAVLLAHRSMSKPWDLALRDERYVLLLDTAESSKGTAGGKVACAQGRHTVGIWAIGPSASNPNRFTLEFQLEGRPKLLLQLKRPG